MYAKGNSTLAPSGRTARRGAKVLTFVSAYTIRLPSGDQTGLSGGPLTKRTSEWLARWLLMSADIVGSSHVHLTQDTISVMLGTRRSSVTVAVGIFEGEGIVANSRGKIAIINRERLEAASCDCYKIMRDQKATWRRESQAG
jgi:CRP-like cAMP-binding protein